MGFFIRAIAAGWFVLGALLAACGGGGSADGDAPQTAPTPSPAQPVSGSVTIPAESEIVALGVGDASQIIYVLPGETTARRLELISNDAAARYDVSIVQGNAFLRVVEADSRWVFVVDSQTLAPGTSHPYRVQVRNRTTGLVAEVSGPVEVLTPEVGPVVQIAPTGGAAPIAGGLGHVVFGPATSAQTLSANVVTARTPHGTQVRVKFDRDVSDDVRTVSLELASDGTASGRTAVPMASGSKSPQQIRLGSSSGFVEIGRVGYFTQLHGFRLSRGPQPLNLISRISCGVGEVRPGLRADVCWDMLQAWKLSRRGTEPVEEGNVEPVLFVHGYSSAAFGPELGGGDGTWGDFAQLVEGLGGSGRPPVRAYEFQWATNASFRQVADDLARALGEIFT